MASDAQDGPASLRQSRAGTSAAAATGDNSSKTPNTPLRRISRGSLSALSASRGADSAGPALAHLAPAFAELADGVEDLAVNMEGLDAVCQSLADFNEAFAGLLFGLRMNAYTSDFHQAPTIRNFDYNKQRAERVAQQELEEQVQAAFEHQQQQQDAYDQDAEDALETHNRTAYNANDTFISQPGDADMLRANKAAHGGARSGVLQSARGGRGGASTTAASTSKAAAAKKKKKQLLDFAHPIIQTLPIDFREKQPQRGDAESIIGSLRAHPEGLRMQDFVKQLPLVPQHRINDCLLALVRAKHAIKMTSKGLLYRLDPMKYPPQPQ